MPVLFNTIMMMIVLLVNAIFSTGAAETITMNTDEDYEGNVRVCDEKNRTELECSHLHRCCEWNNETDVCVTLTAVGNELYCAYDMEDIDKHNPEHTQDNQTDDEQCDESKCVTHHNYNFESAFNCYTGTDKCGRYYSPICADGYLPRIIVEQTAGIMPVDVVYDDGNENEIRYVNTTSHGGDHDNNTTESWQYFTCCPPILDGFHNDTILRRHCSNPVVEHNTTHTSACKANAIQPHARQMKDSLASVYDAKEDLVTFNNVKSFICCDTIIEINNSSSNNSTIQFLDDIECVPYFSSIYREATIHPNRFGQLYPVFCYDPEPGFRYPNYYSNGGGVINTYECCKTSNETILPCIEDTAFYATLIPQIILSALAGVLCTILVMALLLPLIEHLKEQARNGPSRTATISSASAQSTGNFSTYNMYLLYLALPDLALNVYILWMYCGYANQKFDPYFSGIVIANVANTGYNFENAFIGACSTANLYYNCVVSYSVFKLLRSTSQLVRHKPPTLTRITLEAALVYGFSIIIFCTIFFLDEAAMKQVEQLNYRMNATLSKILFFVGLIVAYIIPIGIFFSILIIIKVQHYTPALTGREKELVSKCV